MLQNHRRQLIWDGVSINLLLPSFLYILITQHIVWHVNTVGFTDSTLNAPNVVYWYFDALFRHTLIQCLLAFGSNSYNKFSLTTSARSTAARESSNARTTGAWPLMVANISAVRPSWPNITENSVAGDVEVLLRPMHRSLEQNAWVLLRLLRHSYYMIDAKFSDRTLLLSLLLPLLSLLLLLLSL